MAYDAATGFFYAPSNPVTQYSQSIYSFNPVTDSVESICPFQSPGGVNVPGSRLVYCPANSLYYGISFDGGAGDSGAIYSFNPSTDTIEIVSSFGSRPDGRYPIGALVYNADSGVFYGTTTEGGTYPFTELYGGGILYSFNPITKVRKMLHYFNTQLLTDGFGGNGDLEWDPVNKSYYLTLAAGDDCCGGIASYNPATQTEQILYGFHGQQDGSTPVQGLTYYADSGIFYGMTQIGGTENKGTIIKFDPRTNTETVLHNFSVYDTGGYTPLSKLVFNPDNGLFYGTTYEGGKYGGGIIFSFNPLNNAFNIIWNAGYGPDGYNFKSEPVLYNGPAATPVENIAANHSINLYPNPSSGSFQISGTQPGQVVEVFNSLGQKVKSLKAAMDKITIEMDLSSAGLYQVRVMNADGSIDALRKLILVNQ